MKEIQIKIADELRHFGSCMDSYEELQELAEKKAEKLAPTLGLKPNEYCETSFWTDGMPELICIVTFKCDADGILSWVCDDSQSTL